MRVFHQIEDLGGASGLRGDGECCSVAIGNFDGVHLGHEALLANTIRDGKASGCHPSVLTFFPHPVEVLRPGTVLERLTTTSEKLKILQRRGCEIVLVAKFDSVLAALSPEAFFETYLVDALRAKSVHVGFNFRFGKNRAGDTELLGKLCRVRGIDFHVQEPVEVGGSKVSSSRIREALRGGDVAQARELLGRPYTLAGPVVRGDGRGHLLGFATANLSVPGEKLLPKNGVYATQAIWQRQVFRAVTNIGSRPTFTSGAVKVAVETYLLDFNAKIYDEFLELQLLERIRDERKFSSAEELKTQIQADVEYVRKTVV